MIIQMNSKCSVEETCKKIEEVSIQNKFGVLCTHNLKQKINDKGIPFNLECRVIEVCNPEQAKDVLKINMLVSSMLPCRISVFEENGKTFVTTIRPTSLMKSFDKNGNLMDIAANIEKILEKIIIAACQ